MTVNRDQALFRTPLTAAFHQTAQGFYRRHTDPKKRKQIYLNTLSVQAAQFFLTCLGIETNLENSESWNPILQVLADSSDLWVDDLGRLECRPVLPEQAAWEIPSEVRADRIGYLFIQVDAELTEATLLGFLPKVDTKTVTLEQLQPLDDFPSYLEELRDRERAQSPARIRLQQWLDQVIDASWTALDTLIAERREQNLAFSFRGPLARIDLIEPDSAGAKQGKFLTLGKEEKEQILFIVGIAPVSDGAEFNITVELYPAGNESYLPPALHLMVMDEANIPVLQAEGRQSEGLEFQFRGEAGECFSVQISLNQQTLTEQFEI
ncbi:MAG: DUF1822 family protein [Leptolyngbyaceae cyanobacterium MO_188.B28]|nr:DUF1822 family protein [Leptolyngbyaceae cyanobacterium MO_188.B28]